MELIRINLVEELEVIGILFSFPSYLWSGIFAVFLNMAVYRLSIVLFTSTISIILLSE
jgi:hypothetical protein